MELQKLSENKKELLRKFVDFTCEQCGKTELEISQEAKKIIKLQPHRIRRGCQGGKYELRNIKVVCSKCHKKYHGGEFK